MNVEKEDMEMKVVNVDFVENEMVELDVKVRASTPQTHT